MGYNLLSGSKIKRLSASLKGHGERGTVGPRLALGDKEAVKAEDLVERTSPRVSNNEGVPCGYVGVEGGPEDGVGGGDVADPGVRRDQMARGVRVVQRSGDEHEGMDLDQRLSVAA